MAADRTRRSVAAAAAVAVAGAVALAGCGAGAASQEQATSEARGEAHSDRGSLEDALLAAGGAASPRDTADTWAGTALGEPASTTDLEGGGVELLMVYDAWEDQGGGWFSSEVAVRLCTRLLARSGSPDVALEDGECPADLPAPQHADDVVEIELE